jgi:ferredoxin
MAYVVTAGCIDIKDKACLSDCPVDCLYEGDRMTYIHPEECIDCGACMPLCPQDAIFFERAVPSDLVDYIRINAEFFAGVGSPGSSADVDFTDRDHPEVAASLSA